MASNNALEHMSTQRSVPTIMGHPIYEYTALPDVSHIRQLILDPGKIDDPLSGRLTMSKLEDAPPYEAISYVWGQPAEKDRWIYIDGNHLSITKSMADSLRQTRLRDKCRRLWADSICINQKDDVEKGHQVFIMGRIYERSQRTLICLGIHYQHRRHARDAAALIGEVNRMMDEVFDDPGFSWDWYSFPWPAEDEPLLTDQRWESWAELGRCDWFTRGWVVQEATLAPEAVVLWAGGEIQWNNIVRAYIWMGRRATHLINTRSLHVLIDSHLVAWIGEQQEASRTFYTEYEAERLRPPKTLEILRQSRCLKLSDPKDRIYAFMALPTLDGALARMRLQPDYSKSTSHLDVYNNFAVKYLEETSDLDLLVFIEHDNDEVVTPGSTSCPSWIPRWDRGPNVYNWSHPSFRKLHSDTASDFPTVLDNSILQVNGTIIESVEFISKVVPDGPRPSEAVHEIISLWREIAPHSDKYPGPNENLFCRAMAFLTAVRQGRYDGEGNEFQQSQKAFARLLLEAYEHPEILIDTYKYNKDAQRVSCFARDQSGGRRSLLLSRGYFGVAPQATRTGDVCAIIFGTRLPMILRRVTGKNHHYKVVGAAWIQSRVSYDDRPFRLGEFDGCDDWKDWDLPTEKIYLC